MTPNPFAPPKAVVRDSVTSKELAAAWLKGVLWRTLPTYAISTLVVMILLRWALKDHVSPELSSSVRMVASQWIFALILWSLDVITGRPALSLLPGKNLGLSSTGWRKVTNAVLFCFIALGLWGAVMASLVGPEFRKFPLSIGSGLIFGAFMLPLYKAMVRSPEQFEADRSKAGSTSCM